MAESKASASVGSRAVAQPLDLTLVPSFPRFQHPFSCACVRLPINAKIPLAAALPAVPPSYRPDGSLPAPSDPNGGAALHAALAAEPKAGLNAAAAQLAAILGEEPPATCKPATLRSLAQRMWAATPTGTQLKHAHVLSTACAVAEAADATACESYATAAAAETMVLSPASQAPEFVSSLTDMVAVTLDGAKGWMEASAKHSNRSGHWALAVVLGSCYI